MTGVLVPIGVVAFLVIVVELGRWLLRPEARRLRRMKKIGGRR